MSRMCYFAVIISRGSYGTWYASAQLFRGRRSTFEASNAKSLKRIGILRSSVSSTCHFWRKSRRKAAFLSFNASFFKEVSQKCFVLELQRFIFEGSLAEKLCFLSFKVSILKEVSQKSFVFDVQSFNFEGSLAELLRFWASKLQFWRKSRRNAWFLIFKASILKEVSQESFVFELHSCNFEGSLAEMLRFGASKLHFWRKSRRKAMFLSFTVSKLKEVSQKCLVFDLQSFNFEGSLAEKLRFWASQLQFWRKSRRKASFLSFKVPFAKEVSQKAFFFGSFKSFNFEGNLAEKFRFWVAKFLFWDKFRRQVAFFALQRFHDWASALPQPPWF